MRCWDYPYDPVVLHCSKYGRYGKYSKKRFLELVGRNTSLSDARFKIAKDCPHIPKYSGDIRSQCRVGYPDLLKSGAKKGDEQ